MSARLRPLLVALTAGVLVVATTACGGGDFTQTSGAGVVGYDRNVYTWVDEIGVRSGVPDGFVKAPGRAYGLWGDGPYHKEKGDEGWAAYRVPDKPTRIAVPNSWGGGYTFFNVYELDPHAIWKR